MRASGRRLRTYRAHVTPARSLSMTTGCTEGRGTWDEGQSRPAPGPCSHGLVTISHLRRDIPVPSPFALRPSSLPMTYGITGNTANEELWHPVSELTRRLHRKGLEFCLHRDIAHGLEERGLVDPAFSTQKGTDDVGAHCDLLLSFGGDGTMLKSAHHVGTREVPILGVNVGHLGFLTKAGVDELDEMVDRLEAGQYTVEKRMVIECDVEGAELAVPRWALNDFVLDKSGTTSMIAIEAEVDGAYLNTYWADGLIVSTPT